MYIQENELEIKSTTNTERRRTKRAAARCDCWLERDDITIYGHTADIGVTGFFLRTAIPLTPGSQFDVQLRVDESPNPILAQGLVVRSILARSNSRYGVGVEFLSIQRGREELLSFLDANRQASEQSLVA